MLMSRGRDEEERRLPWPCELVGVGGSISEERLGFTDWGDSDIGLAGLTDGASCIGLAESEPAEGGGAGPEESWGATPVSKVRNAGGGLRCIVRGGEKNS